MKRLLVKLRHRVEFEAKYSLVDLLGPDPVKKIQRKNRLRLNFNLKITCTPRPEMSYDRAYLRATSDDILTHQLRYFNCSKAST